MKKNYTKVFYFPEKIILLFIIFDSLIFAIKLSYYFINNIRKDVSFLVMLTSFFEDSTLNIIIIVSVLVFITIYLLFTKISFIGYHYWSSRWDHIKRMFFIFSPKNIKNKFYLLSDTQKALLIYVYISYGNDIIPFDSIFNNYKNSKNNAYIIDNEPEMYFRLKNLVNEGFLGVHFDGNQGTYFIKLKIINRFLRVYNLHGDFNPIAFYATFFDKEPKTKKLEELKIINRFKTLTDSQRVIIRIIYRSSKNETKIEDLYKQINFSEPAVISSIDELLYRLKDLSNYNLVTLRRIDEDTTIILPVHNVETIIHENGLLWT